MAEYVEQSTEEMLPELEQMCRVGLFTKKETSKILEKRKGHEYKLRRKQKQKEDFLQYIQYETNLLALVRKRRDRTGYTHKKIEIDNNITSRIHRLFKLALYRFPEDLKLWLSYIAFAKQLKALDLISRQYSKMLAVHDKKPDLWLSAAKWEFEDNNNSDNARKLLQRGLRFNPEARKLWLEYYRMELLYAEKTRKRRELLELGEDENSDTVLSGQVAFVVFDQARQAIPDDVSFLVQFLPICQLFDFTKDHEADICKELKEKYSEEPLAWDALAKRHLGRKEDLTVTDNPEKLFHDVYMDAISTLNSGPQAMHDFKAIQLCLPGEMVWDMPIGKIWELYILACLDLFQKASKKSLRLKRLKRSLLVLQKARDAGHVTAPLYARWVDLLSLTGLPEEALDVCCAGLEAHPGETTLWERRLSMMVSLRHDATTVQEALNEAQKHIPKQESWPLVQMVLEHNISCNAANETVKLLEISMIDHAAVSQPAKEFFLEYEYLQHGIAHTRTVYNRLCKYKPLSQQLYRAYISMELAQPKPKMKLVRAAYEDALREHGDQAPDLWLDYIRLESSGLKGKMEKVGQIHFRAVKALQGAHNQEFLRRYTLLQTSEAS